MKDKEKLITFSIPTKSNFVKSMFKLNREDVEFSQHNDFPFAKYPIVRGMVVFGGHEYGYEIEHFPGPSQRSYDQLCDEIFVILRRTIMRGYGRVVHCRHHLYEIYIGRPSQFGNPYTIGRDGNRTMVIAKYRQYLAERMSNDSLFARDVMALKGKVLGCWCSPQPCHGDVLLEIANGQTENGS